MLCGKRWAGVFSLLSLRLVPLEGPHPTSAAAAVGNATPRGLTEPGHTRAINHGQGRSAAVSRGRRYR